MNNFTVFDKFPPSLPESDDDSDFENALDTNQPDTRTDFLERLYEQNAATNMTNHLIEVENDGDVEIFHVPVGSTTDHVTNEDVISRHFEVTVVERSYSQNADDISNNHSRYEDDSSQTSNDDERMDTGAYEHDLDAEIHYIEGQVVEQSHEQDEDNISNNHSRYEDDDADAEEYHIESHVIRQSNSQNADESSNNHSRYEEEYLQTSNDAEKLDASTERQTKSINRQFNNDDTSRSFEEQI